VIPTKNRQKYALAAVESVLKMNARDGEVEVIIRDCSDDDTLCDLLKNRFLDEGRYQYIYDSSKPSMTKNWDLAFSEASGMYVCGIGDDDAVLNNILDVTKYMVQNNIDCMRQPITTFMWPDVTKSNFQNSMLSFSKFFNGNFEVCGSCKELLLSD